MPSAAFLIVPFMLIACQSGQPLDPPIDLAGVDHARTATEDLGRDAAVSTLCADPRADPWALPLTKTTMGDSFRVTLRSAAPTMPQIGMNTWLLDVADSAGKAAPGLSWTARPFMPDHGHGSTTPQVTAETTPGAYKLSALNLSMAGVWQINFTLKAAAADPAEPVVFTYCLAEL